MKKPATYELVSTRSRGRTYFGFAKRGSDTITLVRESKREALQVIHELYYGTPSESMVTGEAHNVPELEDPDNLSAEDVLDTDDEGTEQ